MKIRTFNQEDFDTAAGWWVERSGDGGQDGPPCSPYGVVAYNDDGDAGMVWAYLSVGVGVAFIHHLVMKPGLSLKLARDTASALTEGIRILCDAHGYSHCVTCVKGDVLAGELVKQGFELEKGNWKQLKLKV